MTICITLPMKVSRNKTDIIGGVRKPQQILDEFGNKASTFIRMRKRSRSSSKDYQLDERNSKS